MVWSWKDTVPENNGSFYYNGPLPAIGAASLFVGIIQISTSPIDGQRYASVFIPPGWRGSKEVLPIIYFDKLEKWTGQWAGPELGLECVELP
jgi:hypothetical protein